MTSKIDATYITNTLCYIHLLPLDEQNKEIGKIVHYFNLHSHENNSSINKPLQTHEKSYYAH